MGYERIFQFKGTWRNYQARVLSNAGRYLNDGKVHIVAAPGSGKTTLGIELINRMGKPALVFAPTITIREQWVARIKESFLRDGLKPEDYLSQDLKDLRLITVSTYQSLHSAMNRFKGKETDKAEETDDLSPELQQEVDYSGYDLVAEVKKNHIGVLCLDECHHLRSEWWKALENFKEKCENLQVISLTATPPYDSNKAMWERYMSMCGEIDEEITIPELVKEGSLCPHQDYVYFNYPTAEEKKEVEKFVHRAGDMLQSLLTDADFKRILSSHPALMGDTTKDDELLQDPSYLASILIFASAVGIAPPQRLLNLLGVKTLPALDTKWAEKLLQGMLYEDNQNYRITEEETQRYKAALKVRGLLEKNKVMLTATDNINKLITRSVGKCDSIEKIVEHEYQAMGKDLRLLILTDYIKKEYEKGIGDEKTDVKALGVIPFFEMLRRKQVQKGSQLRLGVLCGTIVIIPAMAKEALEGEINKEGKVNFRPLGNLMETEYVKAEAVGDAHFLTKAVTNLFSKGYMQVLIGTKSLLGEGWDSPCINSLILASFVGSFMLSNQMRGRAIRVMKDHPEKCSNIWHLVCLNPDDASNDKTGEISEDFSLLERRMEHFLGLHYTQDIIQSGMDRLSVIKPPYNAENVAHINEEMLKMSGDRNTLKQRWQNALVVRGEMSIADETEVEKEAITAVTLQDALWKAIIYGTMGLGALVVVSLGVFGGFLSFIFGAAAVFCGIKALIKLPKIISRSTPLRRLSLLGKGILRAMKEKGLLEDASCGVQTSLLPSGRCSICLKSSNSKDKQLFAQCIRQMMGEVDNQRYLLVKHKNYNASDGFYCVPDIFGGNKNDAGLFARCIKSVAEGYDLVYTRNEEGRKILLKGRVKAFANKEARCSSHKKVKGALE